MKVTSLPLILSWTVLGNAYPVTEQTALFGKPCKPGYDSHYVLVKKKEDPDSEVEYYPCKLKPNSNEMETPDYDEIVLFSPDQVLPRYLIYYTRLQEDTVFKHKVLWVDPLCEQNNKKELAVIRKKQVQVLCFKHSKELFTYLVSKKLLESSEKIKIISNRFRKNDFEEDAGSRLYENLGLNPIWKEIPFAIYCGKKKLIKNVPKKIVFDDSDGIIRFATSSDFFQQKQV